ncbi:MULTISPECIES: GNAT family N-acetyltransferase [Kocuria]|uniref:GNAT family N-acetyltransferase n=1 Tax=Kocuria TaxID=57493 RepID=UPI0019D0E999|nr:N-acetyltransferase [Kocuria sp. KRD140]
MHELRIRRETQDDVPAVHRVVERAFAEVEYSDQTEPHIVDALRRAGALTVSLVAATPDVVGHAAASPVTISDGTEGWFGIGPVAVDPDHQGHGVGSALMERLIVELHTAGAHGPCCWESRSSTPDSASGSSPG